MISPQRATTALSVVVPTRNEAGNVRPLVDRLRAALGATPTEIIFVDDSDDDTPDVIRSTGARLVHRPAGQRDGGLGGAVVAGLRAATAPWVVVMDGDLQHPPETVPELLAAGQAGPVDAVVASRYRGRGSADGLAGAFRRLVSRGTGALARLVFPVRLRGVTDPMSGFFAVRRAAVPPDALRPDGYKILLEVLVRARISRVVEVPYTFRPRHAGQSKASLREGLRFGRHLAGLRLAGLRSAPARLVLAFALTAIAFPALPATIWNSLWERGGTVPLLIPLATAAALVIARLRPSTREPDVHDRQVDGLIAAALLVSAGTLAAVAPEWTLVAGVFFLGGAAILLLGTRVAARLRWALLLPLIAAVHLPSGVRGAPSVPVEALAGALVCLAVCAWVTLSGRSAWRSFVPAAVSVIVVGLLFGGFDLLPGLVDAALATAVAVWAVLWGRGSVSSHGTVRQHLPRARFALIALLVAAVVLGVRAQPTFAPVPSGLSLQVLR